jgi:predicted transcriptional regulator
MKSLVSGVREILSERRTEMRKHFMKRLVVALAIAALPVAVFAQVQGDKPEADMERHRTLFLERLSEKLDLDQATTEKLAQSFEQYRGKAKELYKEHKAVKTKLKEAVKGEASESEIEAILAEAKALYSNHRQIREGHQAEVHQILGTRGYAQYVLLRQHMYKKSRRKHHGHRDYDKGSQIMRPGGSQGDAS